jgi:hypothetical protein
MASDQSPPRVRAIAITAFTALAILVGLKFVFDSYYLQMFEAEEYEKIGSVQSKELAELRANEKRNLTTGAVPIDKAMSLLARSREAASAGLADGGITPEQSTDNNPLIGWGKLPQPLTAAEMASGADGGAAPAAGAVPADAADGGATPALASDAGNTATGAGALLDASAAPNTNGAKAPSDAGAHDHR